MADRRQHAAACVNSCLLIGTTAAASLALPSALASCAEYLRGAPWPAVGLRMFRMLATLAALAAVGKVLGATLARRSAGTVPLPPAVLTWWTTRLWLHATLLGVLAATLFRALEVAPRELWPGLGIDAVLACQSAWCLAVLRRSDRPAPAAPRRLVWRLADRLATNAALTLLLGEAVMLVVAHLWPNPVIIAHASSTAHIEAQRGRPGSAFYGRPLNSGGYVDEEFFVAGADDCVIAALGDSFTFGIVPYECNFLTIAERTLQGSWPSPGRLALHNFGIGGTGVDEYNYLLHTEAERYRPSLVVVCTFVGNDVTEWPNDLTVAHPLVERVTLQGWRMMLVVQRLARLAAERARQYRAGHQGLAEIGAAVLVSGGMGEQPSAAIPGYVHDWRLEEPHFSREFFIHVERRRARVCDAGDPEIEAHWARYFAGMAALHDALGQRLRVVVIPDEFQVDDALWQEVGEAPGRDRELPQRRIAAFCAERGIPMLDPLRALRAEVHSGRVYHLQDTHWNTRGNAVAGRELAAFLRPAVQALAAERSETTGPPDKGK
jgi:hypothetical protein